VSKRGALLFFPETEPDGTEGAAWPASRPAAANCDAMRGAGGPDGRPLRACFDLGTCWPTRQAHARYRGTDGDVFPQVPAGARRWFAQSRRGELSLSAGTLLSGRAVSNPRGPLPSRALPLLGHRDAITVPSPIPHPPPAHAAPGGCIVRWVWVIVVERQLLAPHARCSPPPRVQSQECRLLTSSR